MDCGHDTLIAINMIEGCEFCRKYVEKRLARGEMSCKHKVDPWKFCPKCSFNVHVGYIKKQDDKIADLQRQLELHAGEVERLSNIEDLLGEAALKLEAKLAEAVRVLEEIVLFADKFGSSGRCYHLKKIAQDFLKDRG